MHVPTFMRINISAKLSFDLPIDRTIYLPIHTCRPTFIKIDQPTSVMLDQVVTMAKAIAGDLGGGLLLHRTCFSQQ